MIKYGSPPLINALSTILLLVTFTAVILSQRISSPEEVTHEEDRPSLCPRPAAAASLGLRTGRARRSTSTPGPTTSSRISSAVSRRSSGCRVVIDTFDSNEAMYAKLKAGAVRLRPPDPLELHGQPDARPGDAPADRPRPRPQPRPCRSRISEDRGRRDDGPLRPLYDQQHGDRLPQEPGRGLRPLLGDVRPRRPQGPDDPAQRHARDDRGRAQVPGLQPEHDERAGARSRPQTSSWAGGPTSPSSRTSSTRPASLRASSSSSRATAATSSRSARRIPTSPSPSRAKERPCRWTTWSFP